MLAPLPLAQCTLKPVSDAKLIDNDQNKVIVNPAIAENLKKNKAKVKSKEGPPAGSELELSVSVPQSISALQDDVDIRPTDKKLDKQLKKEEKLAQKAAKTEAKMQKRHIKKLEKNREKEQKAQAKAQYKFEQAQKKQALEDAERSSDSDDEIIIPEDTEVRLVNKSRLIIEATKNSIL